MLHTSLFVVCLQNLVFIPQIVDLKENSFLNLKFFLQKKRKNDPPNQERYFAFLKH